MDDLELDDETLAEMIADIREMIIDLLALERIKRCPEPLCQSPGSS